MATYAIGDVQGCYVELRDLLDKVRFDRRRDRAWFVGDLVNRGPQSLEVLRFVKGLGPRAVTVLGNHDFHLIARYEDVERRRKDDTLDAVLDAPDARQLVGWLRTRPLMHVEGRWAMVHAGLLPGWSIDQARRQAREVERMLAGRNHRKFLAKLYGGEPDAWEDSLEGWDRLRVIVNAMTRMRFCTTDGRMEFHRKSARAPRGYLPWYRGRADRRRIVCGHWSQLGLKITPRVALLDSGCVWGGKLSALRLEDRKLFQVRCQRYQKPGGG